MGERAQDNQSRQAFFLSLMGVLTLLPGVVLLVGWLVARRRLTTDVPLTYPLEFSAAPGLILAGAALLARGRNRPRLSLCFATATALFGVGHMVSGALATPDVESSIQLAVQRGMASPAALTTSLCFVYFGAALILARGTRRYLIGITGFLAALTLALAVISCFGYLTGATTTYAWLISRQMALHTAAALIFAGLGIGSLAWPQWTNRRMDVPSYQRALITYTIVGIVGTTLIAVALVMRPMYVRFVKATEDEFRQDARFRALEFASLYENAEHVGAQIASRTQARLLLTAMNDGGLDMDGYRIRSDSILKDALKTDPTLLGLIRRDAQNRIANEVGTTFSLNPTIGSMMESDSLHTGPFDLEGRMCLVVHSPLKSSGGERVGTDHLIVDITDALHRLLDVERDGQAAGEAYLAYLDMSGIRLIHMDAAGTPQQVLGGIRNVLPVPTVRDALAYQEGITAGLDFEKEGQIVAYARVPGTTWSVLLQRTKVDVYVGMQRLLLQASGVIALVLLVSVAGMIALVRPLAGSLVLRAGELESMVAKKTAELEAELIERRDMQKLVEASEARLQRALVAAPFPIMIHSEQGEILFLNDTWQQVTGYEGKDLARPSAHESMVRPPPQAETKDGSTDTERLLHTAGTRNHQEIEITTRTNRKRVWACSTAPLGAGSDGNRQLITMAMDVTDRKLSKQALEFQARKLSESNTMLQSATGFLDSIIENIPAMIVVKNVETLRWARLNQAGEKLLGQPRSELVGKRDQEIFSAETAARYTASDLEVIETGRAVDIREDQLETPSHGPRTVHTRKIPVFNQGGDLQYILAISDDITDLKTAEEETRSVVEAAPSAMIKTDMDGQIQWVNTETQRLFGYTRDELVGQSVDMLVPVHARSRSPEHENFMVEPPVSPMGSGYDLQCLKKDGTEFPADLSLNRVQRGNVHFIVGSISDVTERRQAELALQNSEEYLGKVIEMIPHRIFAKDAEGRYVLANRATAEAHGRTIEEVLDKRFVDLRADQSERAERIRQADLEVLKTGKVMFIPEEESIDANGDVRILQTTKNRIQDPRSGKPVVLGIAIDITEQKNVQADIQSKNRELEMLLYVVSHDLKEPLRAIENFSSILNEEYSESVDEEGQDYIRRVLRASGRMRQLIDDLLILSRARRLTKPTSPLDGSDLVWQALEGLEDRIEESGGTVEVALEEFPHFLVDPVWAKQAIYNLVANAIKFHAPGTPPEIEIAPYVAEGKDTAMGIVVRDRGTGIQAEHADRIFQLFQRAVGRNIEGTGAGLAIVRAVAERHGGTAWAQPREGGGSEFFITFSVQEKGPLNGDT